MPAHSVHEVLSALERLSNFGVAFVAVSRSGEIATVKGRSRTPRSAAALADCLGCVQHQLLDLTSSGLLGHTISSNGIAFAVPLSASSKNEDLPNMPGIDLSQLSSNWKRLQPQLKTDERPAKSSASNDLKRKRPLDGGSRVAGPQKRRIRAPPYQDSGRSRRMGSNISTPNGVAPQAINGHSSLRKTHDISTSDLSAAYGDSLTHETTDDINTGRHPVHKAGKYLALDCEMVGTGPPPYRDDVLARVSMVNFHGQQIYDSYVLPPPGVAVGDYRTHVSGIRREHLVPGYARSFVDVQKDVSDLLTGKVMVGHALQNDLQALLISHPKRDVRDTSRYAPFRAETGGRPPALRHLAKSRLGMVIQTGEHSSLEDARASLMLYKKEKSGFEEENRKMFGAYRKPDAKAQRVLAEMPDDDEDEIADELEDVGQDLDMLDGEEDQLDGQDPDARPQALRAKKKRKPKKRTKR